MPIKTPALLAAVAIFSGSVSAESARTVQDASPYATIENEPAPRLFVDPPFQVGGEEVAAEGQWEMQIMGQPGTMYAASKLAAEVVLKPFAAHMDILALRLFGVYGPGQTNAILPTVIGRFETGEAITLAGNAGVRFNPIFVDDCAILIHRLARQRFEGFQVPQVPQVPRVPSSAWIADGTADARCCSP